MSGETHQFTFWSFIKGLGKFFLGLVLLLQGLVVLSLLLLFLGFAIGLSTTGTTTYELPKKFALVIDPSGFLVEQRADIGAVDVLNDFSDEEPPEIELRDIVDAIRAARDDDRVTGLVLKPQFLFAPSVYASKLHVIAEEIDKFKESGKPVVAAGDFFGQEQYLIASHADEVLLHPEGGVFVPGYGAYRLYYKSLIDKLEVTANVFRVGAYKSALEPFMRDDMSPEDREANLAYLDVLWSRLAQSIESQRGLSPGALDRYSQALDELVAAADGDLAQTALEARLVDAIMTREAQDARIKELAKGGDDDVSDVTLFQYLSDVRDEDQDAESSVGIVSVVGTIVDGEQPSGSAGGDTIAALLKQARENDNMKAIVLRVDSPGGSTFASEIMRQQVLELKKAGKPVVVSMGSLAASGGYWIAADADEIWAEPTTLTGSIGIFGFIPTFERTLAKIGVNADGVGTSQFAGGFDQTQGLTEPAKRLLQSTIEDGYNDFIEIVAEGRDLDPDYVREIAEGRVWVGETAHNLGLVDTLGGLDDAVAAAAVLAGLEEYDVVRVKKKPTAWEEFLRVISDNIDARASRAILSIVGAQDAASSRVVKAIADEIGFLLEFNDPRGAYARCLACGI
ncbi:MAG: signal peptide peptidase SppA [Parvularculaceae bacterium]